VNRLKAGILALILGLACLAGLPFGNVLAEDVGGATASVTVNKDLVSITVTPKDRSETLSSGTVQSVYYVATANYTNAPKENVTYSAEWTSSNETVATIIHDTGQAIIHDIGSTTITAEYKGQKDSTKLTVKASSGGGSSGGGGGGGGSSGTTSLTEYITNDGKFVVEASAESADGKVKITIPKDTVGKNRNGGKLNFISIKEQTSLSPPENRRFVSSTYDIGPSGSTFYPPVYLTFHFADADIPAGVDKKNLVIAYLQDGTWIELTNNTVDIANNTITGLINHLCVYTVMADTTPAKFEVNGISFSPAEIYAKKLFTISATITNTGALFGNFSIVLKINDAEPVTQKMSLGGRQSETISFALTMDKSGVYTADINGLSAQFTVNEPTPEGTVAEVTEPAEPADFVVSELTITPAEVKPAEEVTVSAKVENIGGSSGRYIVVFRIDNKEQARKEITLGAGASETVSFSATKDMAGNYTVDINGMTGEFAVKTTPPPSPTGAETATSEKTSFNWKLIFIFGGPVIIVVVLLAIFYKKSR
jgi:hypothetical protein